MTSRVDSRIRVHPPWVRRVSLGSGEGSAQRAPDPSGFSTKPGQWAG